MAPNNQWTHQTDSVISRSPATVRVKNLQSTITGPQDAWGRHDRPQPISISATVTFEKPFNTTSSGDVLAFDTLHYGFLSKAILAALDRCSANDDIKSLEDLLDYIWRDLTYTSMKSLQFDQIDKSNKEAALVNYFRATAMQITAKLPKASLAGDGVSMTATVIADTVVDEALVPRASRSVKIHDVRIPILIGVNPNEREAKQVVIANVDIDGFTTDSGLWTVEQVVVEVSSVMDLGTRVRYTNMVRI